MRSASLATQLALVDARDKGIVPRDFLWLTVRDLITAEASSFGFWSGDYPVDITVISGTTGLPVTRTYIGDVNLNVGERRRVSNLTMPTLNVSMSAIAPAVQAVLRGYDVRLAKVEVHACLLDTATRLPVDNPEIDFLGEVNSSDIGTAAAGGESLVKLGIVSDAISMLTRKNPRKRSHEGQMRRSGDALNRYSNAVANWQVTWGEVPQ